MTEETSRSQTLVERIEAIIYRVAVHWLLIFNIGVGIYVGLPFAAPVLMEVGATGPANVIYSMYAPLCHQFGYRSWFLFGEKVAYLAPEFSERTGIDPYSVAGRFEARAFVGNDQMGWKVAYCQRDVAIYAAILAGGLLYAFLRSRGVKIKPIHFVLYGIFGVGPIALDGFSQLLSQPPFYFLPYLRESTPLFRTLTGALFGFFNVWLAYPYVEESMEEIRLDFGYKLGLIDPPAPGEYDR